jgi:tetratricopeptide (TPR) repeat protein
MVQLLLEAEQFARKLGDAKRLAAVTSQLTLGYWMLGQHDRALACAHEVQAYAATLESSGLADAAQHNLAMIHHARGDLALALPMLRVLVERFSGKSAGKQLRGWAGYPGVYARTFLISTLSQMGGFAEARHAFEEGRAVADAVQHSHSRTMIMEEYGFCLWVQGEYTQARELLSETLRICERDEVTVMLAPIAARLGVALLETGDLAAGLALLQRDLDRETYKQAAHYGHVYLLIGLSEAKRRSGDVGAAILLAEQAEAATRAAGEQAYRVCALLQLAAALQADPQRGQDALARYDECLSEARRLGMRPWEALAWQGLASHPTFAQDAPRARRALETAFDLWSTLSAPRRCDDVRARLAQLRST